MILSLWRYSHLVLAVSSFLFILVASLTGIILAFEPINHAVLDYSEGQKNIPVTQLIEVLKSNYDEVLSVAIDESGFVKASVLSMEGDSGDFYINPLTGKKVAEIEKQAAIFQFATSLHRSLFLKSTGRFFVGLASFLLFLISITGLVLIIKRQQGIRALFNRVIKDNFYSYYHIYLGRLLLVPILIITVTGVYLSLQRFEILPKVILSHDVDYTSIKDSPQRSLVEFPALRNVKLADLRYIEFPFSPDAEDPYKISLKNKEILVNQVTGEVISELSYPFVTMMSHYSTVLHTGRGSVIWSLVLAAACVSIVFFIYSGFKMTFMRRQGKIKNKYKASECEIVVLVGSETGSTLSFGSLFYKELLKKDKKVFLTQMDKYQKFSKMEQLVIFTSTYGAGEPPANASKFISQLQKTSIDQNFKYSVVGFGSLAYPSYCKFAFDVDEALSSCTSAQELLKLYTINNKSWEAFDQWVDQWGERLGLALDVPRDNLVTKPRKKPKKFKVMINTKAEDSPDGTFLVALEPEKAVQFKPGDLLAIYPEKDSHERLYSIGKNLEGQLLLSIKKHEFGLCSNYLNNLNVGESLSAVRVRNPEFHLKKSQKAIMIATGTGIAPFLGMMADNHSKKDLVLYWGGKNERSYSLYKSQIETALDCGYLSTFIPAYSRISDNKIYVQDLIAKDHYIFSNALKQGTVLMICGSIIMQKEVVAALQVVCENYNLNSLSFYQKRGQVKMDCY
ncbi:PepSY domain-containing protein [Leeuwenhoekiella marinoflava]|uniref:PepSY domain-containing protein n=1 Tax=Leeuwenhoekiella marinoflava TaxID=988 RepID=UPI003002CC49